MLTRRGGCQINLGNKRGMPGAIVFVELSRFKGQHMLCSWSPLGLEVGPSRVGFHGPTLPQPTALGS